MSTTALTVDLHATLRPIAGGKSVPVVLQTGATLADVIDAVVSLHPEIGRQLFTGPGELNPHVHVFVEGRDCRYLEDGMQTVISEGTKLDIFPAVGGG